MIKQIMKTNHKNQMSNLFDRTNCPLFKGGSLLLSVKLKLWQEQKKQSFIIEELLFQNYLFSDRSRCYFV